MFKSEVVSKELLEERLQKRHHELIELKVLNEKYIESRTGHNNQDLTDAIIANKAHQ